ncbi:UDP-3-O-acyl-N-acetylglucosamine deacetylase [Lichenicola sp.]|uniref:UDP-3-O-acyl-N-acetylglucosamine deacetylase n=1 Tax=Lichenicola sp. TaxID=2804529 RepID=UPI003AFFA977
MDGMSSGLVGEIVREPEYLSEIDAGPVVSSFPLRSRAARQHTLGNAISCTGVGLHSGQPVTLTLRPAAEDAGVLFCRTDLGQTFPAGYDSVIDTRLCTVVAPGSCPEARVATVEHLMAALSACGIDNVLVELDGPEVPVLDGSSAPFVFLIDCAGRVEQSAPRGVIEVLKSVRVEHEGAFAELRPSHGAGLSLSLSIAFEAPAIGCQAYTMRLSEQGFRNELADCRTFTLRSEIEALRQAGLARGGSLDNAVVVDGGSVLNPAGLRRPDEFVRHKMLDAIGDLALAGHPLRGVFIGHCSGHGLNNRLLRALLADRSAWRLSGSAHLEQAAA